MHKLLRNLHLGVGLFCAVFLTAYALSAVQMAYPIYVPQPRESHATVAVPVGVDTAARPLALWLMTTQDLRGDLSEVDAGTDRLTMTITRPGTVHDVAYDAATRTAEVTTRRQNAIGLLNRLHHVEGVAHEYWAINAWGWVLFAMSIGLLVLSASGTALWFVRHQERRSGALVLGLGLAWGLTLLVLIRLA